MADDKKITPEQREKMRKHAEAQRRYYQRLKNKSDSGDAEAIKQLNKNKYTRYFAVTKIFVKNKINKEDIKTVNKWLDDRLKDLNKKA